MSILIADVFKTARPLGSFAAIFLTYAASSILHVSLLVNNLPSSDEMTLCEEGLYHKGLEISHLPSLKLWKNLFIAVRIDQSIDLVIFENSMHTTEKHINKKIGILNFKLKCAKFLMEYLERIKPNIYWWTCFKCLSHRG